MSCEQLVLQGPPSLKRDYRGTGQVLPKHSRSMLTIHKKGQSPELTSLWPALGGQNFLAKEREREKESKERERRKRDKVQERQALSSSFKPRGTCFSRALSWGEGEMSVSIRGITFTVCGTSRWIVVVEIPTPY